MVDWRELVPGKREKQGKSEFSKLRQCNPGHAPWQVCSTQTIRLDPSSGADTDPRVLRATNGGSASPTRHRRGGHRFRCVLQRRILQTTDARAGRALAHRFSGSLGGHPVCVILLAYFQGVLSIPRARDLPVDSVTLSDSSASGPPGGAPIPMEPRAPTGP